MEIWKITFKPPIKRENKMPYDELSAFERALARFGDKCALIAGLEIANRISPEDAYQKIKEMYRELKKLRKKERSSWGEEDEEV